MGILDRAGPVNRVVNRVACLNIFIFNSISGPGLENRVPVYESRPGLFQKGSFFVKQIHFLTNRALSDLNRVRVSLFSEK